jgi:hypothetical protein
VILVLASAAILAGIVLAGAIAVLASVHAHDYCTHHGGHIPPDLAPDVSNAAYGWFPPISDDGWLPELRGDRIARPSA